MIHAGIDEAGYGPILGPLVVSCVSVQGDDHACQALGQLLAAANLSAGDSKKIYKSRGLAGLEMTLMPLINLISDNKIKNLGQLAKLICEPVHLDQIPWFSDWHNMPLPAQASASRIDNATETLTHQFSNRQIRMRAIILSAQRYNQLLERFGNKADLMASQCGNHLRWINDASSSHSSIVCDKLGGRKFYSPILQQALPDQTTEVISEHPTLSSYQVGKMLVSFEQGADGTNLQVGLASMLSKYLRELMMLLFNRWWAAKQPGIKPTAGYWQDGTRFIKEIAQLRQELKVADSDLIRAK
jgi:ribonuclease HIII